jgi:hypothetical protein
VHTSGNFIGQTHSIPAGLTCGFPPQSTCVATFAPNTSVTLTSIPDPAGHNEFTGDCTGINSCSLVMDANKAVNVYFFRSSVQAGLREPPSVSSVLDVADGEGRLAANGGPGVAARAGTTAVASATRAGLNRIEAVLVRSAGRPGSWRFDLAGVRPGSLRGIIGTVVSITPDSLVFRVEGKPGERVGFTFEFEP